MDKTDKNELNSSVRYEHSDVNIRGVLYFILGLIIAAILIQIGLHWTFNNLKTHSIISMKNVNAHFSGSQLPPEPRLQMMPGHEEEPAIELQKMIHDQDSLLHQLRWADSAKGIVIIPIEEAEKILITRKGEMPHE